MFGRIGRVFSRTAGSGALKATARSIAARADAARDNGRFADAAFLFETALGLRPRHAGWRVQAGHMRKEARDFPAAERHYLAALELLPNDADLALQLGHFYRTKGSLEAAAEHYRRAASLSPGWDAPLNELASLPLPGNHNAQAEVKPRHLTGVHPAFQREVASYKSEADLLARAASLDGLVPSLVPAEPRDLLKAHDEVIDIRRLGRRERSFWGLRRTLRGVQALRGFCISASPIVAVEIILDGLRIHDGAASGGYEIALEEHKGSLKKYVFNVWIDFGRFAHGLHTIEIRLSDSIGETRSFHDHVVIAAPLREGDFPQSDGIVELDSGNDLPPEEQIRARPSMIRDAHRPLFPGGVHNVLAMRTDQLGDMVASVPALRRLRELLPGARIVGLLTSANADLARTLGLFDEVLIADFPDDPVQRRRVMPLDVQEELRKTLSAYRFDIAIDLAHSSVSRELLPLSGARFLYGHGGGDWPWLSATFEFDTRDPHSAMEATPHSNKVLALVESLGTIFTNHMSVVRREDLSRDLLLPYGLHPDDRFIVLHTGARLKFSHWPHFADLARMLLDETDLKIVMMADSTALRDTLPRTLTESDRFQLIDQRLSFDEFDAFISFATVVVGNDSGPKHLAALRGTNVVTLFTARINWAEWGQENVGTIISRRVPCQGCAIFHDPEECGKEFACIRDIRTQEVFDTVMRYV